MNEPIPMLLVTALGLQPDAFAHRLHIVRPLLPPETSELHIRRLRIGARTVDLRFAAGKGDNVSVEVESAESPLEVTVE